MRVVIAGGHGKVALHLERLLAARGDEPVGLIRRPEHADDVRAAGARPVLCDLERVQIDELAVHLDGADAVVFAAGAGPGSGAARKEIVDRDAAVLLADAAQRAGVRRYVMVSALSVDDADPHPPADDVFAVYRLAKKQADDDLRRRDLDWTIVRPGSLTDEPATGRVRLAPSVDPGAVPRADVAAVLAAVLHEPATIGTVLGVVAGADPVDQAVRAAGR